MTDVDNQMGKMPHPFVNGEKMSQMNGQLVAIVGKVERVENDKFIVKTTDGKSAATKSKVIEQMLKTVIRHIKASTFFVFYRPVAEWSTCIDIEIFCYRS